jgi:hypothetical protein
MAQHSMKQNQTRPDQQTQERCCNRTHVFFSCAAVAFLSPEDFDQRMKRLQRYQMVAEMYSEEAVPAKVLLDLVLLQPK